MESYSMTKTQAKSNLVNIVSSFMLLLLLIGDWGNFGIFRLNLFQYGIIALGLVLVGYQIFINKRLQISWKIVAISIYVLFVTFYFVSGLHSIFSVGYFGAQLMVLYWFIQFVDDHKKILQIIFWAAFILAVIAIIQELAYFAHIPAIYDTETMGISGDMWYESNGTIRPCSLCSEPAHMAPYFAPAIVIGLEAKKLGIQQIKLWQTVTIVVATLLTQSVVVWVSVAAMVVYYLIIYKRNIKVGVIALAVVILFFAVIVAFNIFPPMTGKIINMLTWKSDYNGGEGSSFAVISNINIAISKNLDGYVFGTGYDSHKLYYYDYIHRVSNTTTYVNVDEAASMYGRVLSEFGIVGFVALFGYAVHRLIIAIRENDFMCQIMITAFLVYGLRRGQYLQLIAMLPFVYYMFIDGRLKFHKK